MICASFNDSYPVIFDNDGKPLVGRVKFMTRQSTEYREIFLEPEGITRGANPMKTNECGRLQSQVFLPCGEGEDAFYKVVVEKFLGEDPEDMEEYWDDDEMWSQQYDYILTFEKDHTIKSIVVEATRFISQAPTDFGILVVTGFYTNGDSPARIYTHTDSTPIGPNDGVTKIQSDISGWWVWKPQPVVNAACFGIIGGLRSDLLSPAMQSLQSYVGNILNTVEEVFFESGMYAYDADITLPVKVHLDPNARFVSAQATTLTCMEFEGPSNALSESMSLSVSKGDFKFSWLANPVITSNSVGSPSRIIVDADKTCYKQNFFDTEFVGSFGRYKVTGWADYLVGVSFTRCKFSNGPIFSSVLGDTRFTSCGVVRTGEISSDDFPMFTIAESTDTKFIADTNVSVDKDYLSDGYQLELVRGGKITSGSYFVKISQRDGFDDNAFVGAVILQQGSVYKRRWYANEGYLQNAIGKAGYSEVDLCGMSGGGSLKPSLYRNGSALLSFSDNETATDRNYVFEDVTFNEYKGHYSDLETAKNISFKRCSVPMSGLKSLTATESFYAENCDFKFTEVLGVLRCIVEAKDATIRFCSFADGINLSFLTLSMANSSAKFVGISGTRCALSNSSVGTLNYVQDTIDLIVRNSAIDGVENVVHTLGVNGGAIEKDGSFRYKEGEGFISNKGIHATNTFEEFISPNSDLSDLGNIDFSKLSGVAVLHPTTNEVSLLAYDSSSFPNLKTGTILLVTKNMKNVSDFSDSDLKIKYKTYKTGERTSGESVITYTKTITATFNGEFGVLMFVCLDAADGLWDALRVPSGFSQN